MREVHLHSGSGREDLPILVDVIQDSPCPAHDTGEGLLVDVNGQVNLSREQSIEPTNH